MRPARHVTQTIQTAAVVLLMETPHYGRGRYTTGVRYSAVARWPRWEAGLRAAECAMSRKLVVIGRRPCWTRISVSPPRG